MDLLGTKSENFDRLLPVEQLAHCADRNCVRCLRAQDFDRFGAKADDDFSPILSKLFGKPHWEREPKPLAAYRGMSVVASLKPAGQKIHPQPADEARHEQVGRVPIDFLWRPDLLKPALTQHCDAVRDRKGIHLVVRHHDHGCAEGLLQTAQFASHRFAKGCVEIADRLVKKIEMRLLDNRASDRDPLLFAATDLANVPIQKVADAKQLGNVRHTLFDLGGRYLAHLERVAEIPADREVRVESIALEGHADMAMPRLERADIARADKNAATLDLLEAGNKADQRRLAATRRSEQAQEFAVMDFQVEFVENRILPVRLPDPEQANLGHRGSLRYLWGRCDVSLPSLARLSRPRVPKSIAHAG
ncbi:MAG TPA: hypothetical protein VMA37_01745 [Acetobacteraceae bacterium]|nr:hypothetical protein [Acetobacteraceae bacterium]